MSNNQGSSSSEGKKRKWDVPTPSTNTIDTPAEVAAQIAAQKLTSILQAQGIIKKTTFEHEVNINDCKPDTRYYLCKGTTQEELMQKYKCAIKTRGVYKPPGDSTPGSGLHMLITAETQEDLDACLAKVKEIMKVDETRTTPTISPPSPIPPGLAPTKSPNEVGFMHKVMVGMEGCDAQFGLLPRILGPNGSYIQHIVNTSGAKVQLRGIGSGYLEGLLQKEAQEPMHLYISSTNRMALDKAKSLCDSLLSTIRSEYLKYTQMKNNPYAAQYSYYSYPPPAYGYGAVPPAYPPAANPYAAYPPADYSAYGYPVSPTHAQMASPSPSQQDNTVTMSSSPPTTPTKASIPPSAKVQQAKPSQETPTNGNQPKEEPKEDDPFAMFYSELSQVDKTIQPITNGSSNKSDSAASKSNGSSSETPEEIGEKKKEPFWAAPNAIDESKSKSLEQIEKDVYDELGGSKRKKLN